jgi:hypothetical protein
MLRFLRAELVLTFLLGVMSVAVFETILSYQALHCSDQQQAQRSNTPNDKNPPAANKPDDGGHEKKQKSVGEPFACSIAGAPAALRQFMNHNEGFFVGGFTFMLVFVTGWLVWATLKLWRAGEDQRKSSERIAERQRRSSERIASWQRMSDRSANQAAHAAVAAAEKSVVTAREIGEAQARAYLSCEGATFTVNGSFVSCEIRFRNHGQSPAIWTEVVAGTVTPVREDDPPAGVRFIRSERFTGGGPAIAAQGVGKIFTVFLHGQMGDGSHEAIWKSGARFSVEGRVSWRDVFDKTQTQGFFLEQASDVAFLSLRDSEHERSGEMTPYNAAKDNH